VTSQSDGTRLRFRTPQPTTTAAAGSTSTSTSTPTSTPTSTSTPTAASTPTPTSAPAPTTGALTLDKPAAPGKVWLDGKKVTVKSGDVACGKHQLKVGAWGKPKSISIPCGGELHVSK
jgi:hypothetical protein